MPTGMRYRMLRSGEQRWYRDDIALCSQSDCRGRFLYHAKVRPNDIKMPAACGSAFARKKAVPARHCGLESVRSTLFIREKENDYVPEL